MEISNRNEKFFVKLVLLKERVVPSPAKRLSDWYWALPLAGNEQCTVTGRGSDLLFVWQVRLWRLAFVRGAGKHWATV